jgi:hypothetical protein
MKLLQQAGDPACFASLTQVNSRYTFAGYNRGP